MVRRATMTNVTVSIQTKALYFIDEYAQKNRLSRSGAADELLQMARAYLKVLDVQDDEKGGEELEIPGPLLKRQQSMVGNLEKWYKDQKVPEKTKTKPQKRTKKAKTRKG